MQESGAASGGRTPDLAYDLQDGSGLKPSWRANRQHLNDEHARIFEIIEAIPGWQMEGDAYKLYEMGYFAGNVIFEIGTFGGKSAVCELLGARANPARKRAVWFGVDSNRNSIGRTAATLKERKLDQHCTLFHGNSERFFRKHRISPTMVFVDGDHSYEGVRKDIDVLSGVLDAGVPVLCHDYLNPDNDTGKYGVRKATQEWEQSGHVKFLGTFGCSALFVTLKGAARPAGLWGAMRRRLGK